MEYDLEERSARFAEKTRDYVKLLPRTKSHIEYSSQLIRSSGSVAANYIEANEALSKKDFYMRIRISKKECKESRLWLRLTEPNPDQIKNKLELMKESTELIKIFSTILKSSI